MFFTRLLVSAPVAETSAAASVTAFGLAVAVSTGLVLQAIAADPFGGLAVSSIAVAAGLSAIAAPILAVPALLAT